MASLMAVTPEFSNVSEGYGRLLSYTLPAPGLSVWKFLRYAHGDERFYWQDSRENTAFAGMGTAAELMAWGKERFKIIETKAVELFADSVHIIDGHSNMMAGPRLFGGFAFQDDFVPDNTWMIYTPAYFVLPHYQLTQHGDETLLTINAMIDPDDDAEAILPELREALQVRYEILLHWPDHSVANEPMHPLEVNYPMTYDVWERIITDATQRIQSGELKKVVLARVCEIRFMERVNVDHALAYLNEQYANSYRFLFEPRPYHAFYGATPELLAGTNGKSFMTMGLAGSIQRGTTPEEDRAYATELLNDPKNLLEHALVVDAIKAKLEPIADELTMPNAPQIYQLSNIQHLYTPIEGQFKDEIPILRLLGLLHPTPALGGEPRESAMHFIRDAEPVPRGWYAGPIGWIGPQLDGEFGVAIRSAVSQDRRVWLYAGAGIVGDSIPRKEWDETALKFRPMLNALGIYDTKHMEK